MVAGEAGVNLRSQVSNFRGLWWWLRQVAGDAAYENYLRSRARRCGGGGSAAAECSLHGAGAGAGREESERTLTREEFYLDALRRRYSGVSRCC
jgi:hypothetical protein